jgi:uncharacterized membrane protein YedE/YeeE
LNALIALLCGVLFGTGVCISGMVRPSKVLGFLDVAGHWDASLLLVLGSGFVLHAVAWQIVKRRSAPVLGGEFPGPASAIIDLRLIGGAALFGLGWGLSGYCPGPALVSLVSGVPSSFVFVGSMVAAMWGVQAVERARG